MAEGLVIGRRFNGPPDSAQGGYACGRFALEAAGPLGSGRAVVTLHEPPPLDAPMRSVVAGGRVHFWHGEILVASVSRAGTPIETVPFVAPEAVAAAEHRYVGADRHPFAGCFVCGPGRADGLGLSPGPVSPGRTGCRWTPDPSLGATAGTPVPVEFGWAALDCPGGWTVDLAATPMVLSRFSAEIIDPPVVGTGYLVVGRRDAVDGHTLTTTTALYRRDGVLAGRALARWVRTAVV